MATNFEVLKAAIDERKAREAAEAAAPKTGQYEPLEGWDVELTAADDSPGRKASEGSGQGAGGDRDELMRMCAEVDLLALIQADTGEVGHKSGDRYDFHNCPVCGHYDDFSYYESTNSWSCYGGSNPNAKARKKSHGGNVLDYLQHARGMTDATERVKWLREATGHPYEPKPKDNHAGGEGKGGNRPTSPAAAQLYANADAGPAIAQPVYTFAELLPKVNRNRPEVIEGLLFEDGEMIIQAPPKTGKTTAELAIAACATVRGEVFGHRITKPVTLYINTEGGLDDYGNTLADIMQAVGDVDAGKMHIWDISGKTAPLDLLEKALIEKANAIDGLGLILLDSVFPVLTGEENSNTDMSYFTNILQRIRLETGAALVFVHHTSKGAGQYTETMYRSSGAGVWARHPTTILDIAPVKVKPETRKARMNIEQCRCIDGYLENAGCSYEFAADTRKVADDYRRACVDVLEPHEMSELINLLDAAEKRVTGCKAVKVTVTRRGAQEPPPARFWYDYPLFVPDVDGLLKSTKDDDGKPDRDELTAQRRGEQISLIDAAVEACQKDGAPPTRANVLERIGKHNGKAVTKGQLTNWTGNKATWSPWRVADDGTNELRRIDAEAPPEGL